MAEHLAIVARELNPERKAFYKLAWHLGAAQSDLAFLEAENVDWENHVISYARRKTGTIAIMRFDEDMAEILRDLPGNGPLFPYLRTVRAGDRATEFKQRCVGLGSKASRCIAIVMRGRNGQRPPVIPNGMRMENLGHNSKAMDAGIFAQSQSGIAVAGRIRTAAENHHRKPVAEPTAKAVTA